MYINISSSLGNYLLWPPSIYGAFCPSSSWWSQALPVPSLPSTAARCCSRCQPQCTAQFWRRNGWLRWKSWFIHVSSVDACCYLLLMVLKWKKNMSKLAMFSTYSLKKTSRTSVEPDEIMVSSSCSTACVDPSGFIWAGSCFL